MTIQFMETKAEKRYSTTYLLTVDGAALTKARFDSNITLESVAHYIGPGMNKSTVSRWEQGILQPSPERLAALVKLFGTNDFIRLNDKATITDAEKLVLQGLRKELVVDRLNGKAVLTAEEIEVVRKMREG
jgi:transcriptional regulator with XRE-family HTH domain